MDKGSDTGRGGRATARSSRGRGRTASTPPAGSTSLPPPPPGHTFRPPLLSSTSHLRPDIIHAPFIRPPPIQSRTAPLPLTRDTSRPSSSSHRSSLSPASSDNEQEHQEQEQEQEQMETNPGWGSVLSNGTTYCPVDDTGTG